MVNAWFYMAYALSYVKCDMFVFIIGTKYLQSLSVFDVLNSINHMDAWIKFPVDVLITDEISH